MKNRKPIIIIILLIVVVIVFPIVSNISQDKPLLFGDMWRDTPEEAFEYAINERNSTDTADQKNSYKIRNLIDIIKFENTWFYLYISESDTFTVTQCAYDPDKDKWACLPSVVYQYDKDIELKPYVGSRYDLWECNNLTKFYEEGKESALVFAFLETGITEEFYFNNIRANVRTYTFEENGKTYSIDCFYIDNFPKDIKYKDIDLEYFY
jgi:hypothetical protein